MINSSFWQAMCLQWIQGNWRWVLGLVVMAAAVDLWVRTMQFSFAKRYFTVPYFYQIAVILLIHIVKHIASVISALSLVQHTETNIAKRLLGCVILTVYLCFIMLNVFNSQQVATGRSRAAHRRVIIYVHPYAHLFTLEDRVSFAIMSVYLCFNMLNFVRFTAGSCRSVAGHASVCDYLRESICSSFYT